MKTIPELKQELATWVTTKREATAGRREYKRTRTKVPNTPDYELMGAWDSCRRAKADARYAHLALCMARGRRYWECERKTEIAPYARHLAPHAGCTATEAQAWLDVKPSAEELAEWNAHVERSRAAARAAWAVRVASRLATAAE